MKNLNTSLLLILIVAHSLYLQAADYSGRTFNSIPSDLKNKIDAGAFFIENNGVKIWYKVSGNGPVCILPTPGWGPGSELYYKSMDKLEEIFTMVYIDIRGTGKSDRPTIEQYTTSNILSDLEAVRKKIKADKIWLMGHSKGGAIVLNYATQFKERVNGIILINSSGGVNTPSEVMQNTMNQKQNEPWYAAAKEYFYKEPSDEKDWITGIKTIMPIYFSTTENFEKSKHVLMNTTLSYDAFKAQEKWFDCENDLDPKLHTIDIPVLVIVGMDDFICGPYVANHLHSELPNSKLIPVENAGHFPWLEQPEIFFKAIIDNYKK